MRVHVCVCACSMCFIFLTVNTYYLVIKRGKFLKNDQSWAGKKKGLQIFQDCSVSVLGESNEIKLRNARSSALAGHQPHRRPGAPISPRSVLLCTRWADGSLQSSFMEISSISSLSIHLSGTNPPYSPACL